MEEINTNQGQEANQPASGISTEGQSAPVAEAKPELVRVKVNGREMELTQDQLRDHAQKSLAGEDNLRKAAALREDTLQVSARKQGFSEIGELLTKAIQENDWGAARTAMIQLGYPERQVDAQINKAVQAQRGAPPPRPQGRQAPVSGEVQQMRTEIGQLVEVVKALGEKAQIQEVQLDKLDSEHLNRMATDIQGQVRQAAQNHGKLGAYLMKTGPRADRIHDMVWAAVKRRANEDGNQGLPSLTENAIAEVLASVHDLDIPTGVDVPQIPGIGPTPGSSTPYPTEAPKPARIDDQGYGQNVLQRLQAEMLRRHMEDA